MDELTMNEQAMLLAFTQTDGFKILNEKIMKPEVLKFNASLLNAKKPEDIIIAHNLASAAAKFYQGVIDRINAEIYAYTNTPRETDIPVDITDGVLNLQDFRQED